MQALFPCFSDSDLLSIAHDPHTPTPHPHRAPQRQNGGTARVGCGEGAGDGAGRGAAANDPAAVRGAAGNAGGVEGREARGGDADPCGAGTGLRGRRDASADGARRIACASVWRVRIMVARLGSGLRRHDAGGGWERARGTCGCRPCPSPPRAATRRSRRTGRRCRRRSRTPIPATPALPSGSHGAVRNGGPIKGGGTVVHGRIGPCAAAVVGASCR